MPQGEAVLPVVNNKAVGPANPLSTAQVGGATLTTGQVSVAVTATLIIAAHAGRYSVVVKNMNATVTCYLGAAGVSTATGHALGPGEAITFAGTFALYGIVATGSVTVSYAEEAA